MKVRINDRVETIARDTTVADILRARRLEPAQTLVELNGRIVQPEDFDDVRPREGDTLKVYTIVCGG